MGTGIFHPQQGLLTVTGGTIKGDTGIEVRAGTLDVTGSTITGTAASFVAEPNLSGKTTHGVGIAVSQHGTNLPLSVNISKGEGDAPVISGQYALYEEDLQDELNTENISILIQDGTFTSTGAGENAQAVFSENVIGFIRGGTFSADPGTYVAEGFSATEISGTWTVTAK